jgi:uncharacterized repeat protein (TIGR01451 family)
MVFSDWRRWLHQLFRVANRDRRRHARRPLPPRSPLRPCFERLEDRTLFSVGGLGGHGLIGVRGLAPAAAAVVDPDVGITKFAPGTVTAGNSFTYTLFITNNGPGDATNVQVTDNLPFGVTFQNLTFGLGAPPTACAVGQNIGCTTPTLLANQSLTLFVKVLAPSSDANGTVLSNSATVTSNGPDANSANDSSTVTTTVLTEADVGVTKTAPTR